MDDGQGAMLPLSGELDGRVMEPKDKVVHAEVASEAARTKRDSAGLARTT